MLETKSEVWKTRQRSEIIPGIISSYALAAVAIITLCFAAFAIPISGANARDGGISYPYLNTVQQYPRDYIWQYFAMLLLCLYLANYIIIKGLVLDSKSVFTKIGFAFAMISTQILLVNYYIQVNVVVISLINKEYDAIPIITQYNPHGIFIALEELGYIAMIISFSCLIPVFWKKNKKLEKIPLIYLLAVIVSIIGYIGMVLQYGLDKKDRFESIIITASWITLIINGILIGNKLRSELKPNN